MSGRAYRSGADVPSDQKTGYARQEDVPQSLVYGPVWARVADRLDSARC